MNSIPAPVLSPELQAAVNRGSEAVRVVLDAASKIVHDQSDPQIYALAIYASVVELFSACVGLAQLGEPTAIPVILRSMYEAHVDLDNLLHDARYVEHLTAANLKQTLKLMRSGPLQQEFQQGRKVDFEQFTTQLAALKAKGKGPLEVWERYKLAGRTDEYESLYALFCLDGHNNGAALADRHLSERADGNVVISFFGDYEPAIIARRLDFGLKFLLQSAHAVHSAFKVSAPKLDEFATGRQDKTATGE
jgi:Family of unknown function (DUF5677)